MPTDDIVVRRIPPVRVAELTATAASYEPDSIGPVIQPLYVDLMGRITRAGVAMTGPAVAYYEDSPDGEGAIVIHAAAPVAAEPRDEYDFTIVDLPEIRSAATIVHRGSMDNVVPTGQTLARWIDTHGYRSAGYARELYLTSGCEDQELWVTELQEPIIAT